jgi:hypothetical protein
MHEELEWGDDLLGNYSKHLISDHVCDKIHLCPKICN